jgi:hypothetical protein
MSLTGANCSGQSCTANGVTYNPETQYEWSCGGGSIQSQSATGAMVKWDCPAGGNFLRCDAYCVTYQLVETKDTAGNVISRNCVSSKTFLATKTLMVTPKCPPEVVNIVGPDYIPCCDNNSYFFSAGSGGGDYNYEWTVPGGWTLNSGQGSPSVLVTPANGQNGAKVQVTVWPKGCDKTLAGTTGSVTITRMPQLTKTGVWPNVICSTGTVTLCVDSLPCTNFQWSDSVGNFKDSIEVPSVTNRIRNGRCYTFKLEAGGNDNFGFVDINLRATSPCGEQILKHRIKVPARFRNISSSDCNQYPAGPAPLSAEKQEINPMGRLHITPNPASGKVQLSWAPGETGRLLVYDLNGRLVMENPKLVSGSEVSLPGLPAGSYMVKVSSGHTWYVNRLMLQ